MVSLVEKKKSISLSNKKEGWNTTTHHFRILLSKLVAITLRVALMGGGEKNLKKNNFLKHLRRTNDVSKKNQNVCTTCTSYSYVVYEGEST